MASAKTPSDPPLFSFEVTNPITFLKAWWKKVMTKEGVDLHLKIKPVTAVLISTILIAGGAGAGWFGNSILRQVPVVKDYIPSPSPSPTPWVDTAYSGTLRKVDSGKYYLQTGDGQAISLSIPTNINLDKYLSKKIFANGKYYPETKLLVVESATDLEIVIQSTSVPTPSPTPSPTFVPETEPML